MKKQHPYKYKIQKPVPLGVLPIHFKEGWLFVTGGPYGARLNGYLGVKMAKELTLRCDVSIPTEDFKTPDKADLDKGLYKVVRALLSDERVYVGCYAGKGRTGLFMAVLCKAFGYTNPVEHVRANYYPKAVETKGQYDFVMNYRIPLKVRGAIFLKKYLGI